MRGPVEAPPLNLEPGKIFDPWVLRPISRFVSLANRGGPAAGSGGAGRGVQNDFSLDSRARPRVQIFWDPARSSLPGQQTPARLQSQPTHREEGRLQGRRYNRSLHLLSLSPTPYLPVQHIIYRQRQFCQIGPALIKALYLLGSRV